MNMEIPEYQRPYKWSGDTVNTLFYDIVNAMKKVSCNHYRIGTIILHQEKGIGAYKIVDGQQRIITLSILLNRLLDESKDRDLKKQLIISKGKRFTEIDAIALKRNNKILKELVEDSKDKNNIKEFLLNNCYVAVIVTNSEQEAFQFFDSQNYRGKHLDPHDLLKAYHLREIYNENNRKKVVDIWENRDSKAVKKLFEDYLFPLVQWYKYYDGLDYDDSKISVFKGVVCKNGSNYNFAKYIHMANQKEYVHQLTQPLIAGEGFFDFTDHYEKLLSKVNKRIKEYFGDNISTYLPEKNRGDAYLKCLFECALTFFADRFNVESLSDTIIKKIYIWSYALRIVMHAIYPKTINKYALGENERVNTGINIFSLINQLNNPEELSSTYIPGLDDYDRIKKTVKKDILNKQEEDYKTIFNMLRGEKS